MLCLSAVIKVQMRERPTGSSGEIFVSEKNWHDLCKVAGDIAPDATSCAIRLGTLLKESKSSFNVAPPHINDVLLWFKVLRLRTNRSLWLESARLPKLFSNLTRIFLFDEP